MTEDATPTIESVIDTFERRARGQWRVACIFLVLMLAGIVAATLVFIFARAITEGETTTTDTTTRISSLDKLIAENNRTIDEKFGTLNGALYSLLNELPNKTKADCKHIKSLNDDIVNLNLNSRDLEYFIFSSSNWFTKSNEPISKADMIGKLLPQAADGDCLSIDFYYGALSQREHRVIILDVEQLKDLKSQHWSTQDPSPLKRELDELFVKRNTYTNAYKQLQERLNQQKIDPLIGEKPPNLSLPFLFQLNINRFGTITLVVIALGILTPLYRFSARLATFYQLRADLFRVHEIAGYKRPGIVQLSSIFTPTFDFGKSQAMPAHLTELIKVALAHGKDTE
jgi:hypothetical protein